MTGEFTQPRQRAVNGCPAQADDLPGWDAARGGWVLDETHDSERIDLRPPPASPSESDPIANPFAQRAGRKNCRASRRP